MTNEQAKKMLKAKLECLKRETSGTDIDCNCRNCDECNLCYEQGNMGEQKEALDMTIKALEQTSWIPVTERLPDTDDEVLCWYEYYHWSREKVLPEYGIGGYLRETSEWFGEVANGKDVRVIAWMPLPQPYKAESEDEE